MLSARMGHASRSRHVIWVLCGSTACSPRHFRQRETKHPGIVGPQEALLSRRHEGLVHPHRYCRRPQADHVFELRDAVSLNFDLLFTPLQQPAFKTNCFFLNANLFARLFQRPALRYRHPDFGYFRRQALQISVRFLKFIRLHRYRLKLCLMLIVCAMFRLGEPRPLRRPLGLSTPIVPLFSRADWGGRSASAPSAAVAALVFSRRSRWAMSASFSSSSRSSLQFQVRRNRPPSRSTKL